jgi:hypothetical protein
LWFDWAQGETWNQGFHKAGCADARRHNDWDKVDGTTWEAMAEFLTAAYGEEITVEEVQGGVVKVFPCVRAVLAGSE